MNLSKITLIALLALTGTHAFAEGGAEGLLKRQEAVAQAHKQANERLARDAKANNGQQAAAQVSDKRSKPSS